MVNFAQLHLIADLPKNLAAWVAKYVRNWSTGWNRSDCWNCWCGGKPADREEDWDGGVDLWMEIMDGGVDQCIARATYALQCIWGSDADVAIRCNFSAQIHFKQMQIQTQMKTHRKIQIHMYDISQSFHPHAGFWKFFRQCLICHAIDIEDMENM